MSTTARQLTDRLLREVWNLRRLVGAWYRRFGLAGFVLPASLVVCAFDLAFVSKQAQVVEVLQARMAASPQGAVTFSDRREESGAARLKAFEDLLVPNDEIPDVVEDLLHTAGDEHVTIEHAEYQMTPDPAGGFLRYKMTFPAKAEATAVFRFVERILRDHRTVTLESVRLTRQEPDAARVDARVQLVLLAHLPSTPGDAGPLRRLSASGSSLR